MARRAKSLIQFIPDSWHESCMIKTKGKPEGARMIKAGRMKKTTYVKAQYLLVSLITGLWIGHAQATPYSIFDFVRLSGPEFLNPQFAVGGGQTTIGDYSGFVEVIASGTGLNNVSNPDNPSDSFYNFEISSGLVHGLFDNTLRLGTETQLEPLPRGFGFNPNCSLHVECGAVHVAELAIAYEGVSFAVSGDFPLDVNAGFAPDYSPGHRYRFVMDLGGYAGTLTLGYGDGGTHDNSGGYDIELYQVVLAQVPEPPAIAIFLAALLGTFWFSAKRPRWQRLGVSLFARPRFG